MDWGMGVLHCARFHVFAVVFHSCLLIVRAEENNNKVANRTNVHELSR